MCNFVTKARTSRAPAHIKGVLSWANFKACSSRHTPIYCDQQQDDDRRVAFINAQKTIGRILHRKEQCLEGKKGNNKWWINFSNLSWSNQDYISFNVADSSSFALMIKASTILDIHQTKSSFKATKTLPANGYLESSLTKHTGQLSNLQLWFFHC